MLQGSVPAFLVANPDRVVDSRKENFSVSNFPGARSADDRLHSFLYHLIDQHDLDLHLGDQIDRIFASPVKLRVSLLPAMSARFEYRHAFHADSMQSILHRLQLRYLYDRFD